MSEKFSVEIISPDKSILKSDAREVIIPSYEGEMGIMNNHIPIITFLRPGFVKIKNDSETTYYIEEGTVEFMNNKLLILTSTAILKSDFDKGSVETLINDAEKKISNNEASDKEKYFLLYKIQALKTLKY